MQLEKKWSISPISRKKYLIPDNSTDIQRIDEFIEENKGKQIVVVQGLGFVGAVMSLVCANAITTEYAVIGLDLANENSYWKIGSINDGEFPITSSDTKINEFFNNTKNKRNFLASSNPYAYSKADFIIIDINLDVDKFSDKSRNLNGFNVDLSGFRKAIQSIGDHCSEKALILVETTVPPGTTEKVVKPIVEEGLLKRGLSLNKYTLGHSYERVMPGPNYIDSIQNFYRVYSGINEKSADAVEVFLRTIVFTDKFPLTRLGNTNATEIAKVLENSFRAMNIAFIVEWTRFAEEAGINLYEVVNAIRMRPTHQNIMFPGIGVGGYCLTKDPLLASWSRQNMFNGVNGLDQSETGVKINDKMPEYAFEFLRSHYNKPLEDKNVLLLGVSYLNDVGDTRYTPVEFLYELLKKEKAIISLHDPYVSYWAEKDINVSSDLSALLNEQYDIIIISTGHKEYRKNISLIEKLCNQNNVFILDTINVFESDEIEKLQSEHVTKILGRGDL